MINVAVGICVQNGPDRDLLCSDFHAVYKTFQNLSVIFRTADDHGQNLAQTLLRQLGGVNSRLQGFQILGDDCLLLFQRLDLALQRRACQTVQDGIQCIVQLAGDFPLFLKQRLQSIHSTGLQCFRPIAQNADQAVSLPRISQNHAHRICYPLFKVIGADGLAVAVVQPFLSGAAVVVVVSFAGADGHGGLAVGAEDLSAQGVFPVLGRPAALLALVL